MRRLVAVVATAIAASALAAIPEPSADEVQNNRKRLEQWRKHPSQMAQLRRHAQAFLALSPERRQQLLQLDQQLHEQASADQVRLMNVAERYEQWLDELRQDAARQTDYERLLAAADSKARLEVLRDLRYQEWLRDQPKAVRDELGKLKAPARAARVHSIKEDDRQREREWLIAGRFWSDLVNKRELPARLSDFPKDVEFYVSEYLQHFLSKEEKDRLKKAQGKWPLYPMTLVELADKHPPALPGPEGPRRFDQLPKDVFPVLKVKNPPKFFPKAGDGKWPEFGARIAGLAASRKPPVDLPHELWPYRFSGLSKPMQAFVQKTLQPALDTDDKLRLLNAPQSWPEYPSLIQQLSQKYNLQPPWFTLPGPRKLWDPYRLQKAPAVQGLPELPQQKLRDFVKFGLSAKEREGLKAPFTDPAARQRLHQIYFEKNPQELKSIRQRDQRKMGPNPFLNMPREKWEKWDL